MAMKFASSAKAPIAPSKHYSGTPYVSYIRLNTPRSAMAQTEKRAPRRFAAVSALFLLMMAFGSAALVSHMRAARTVTADSDYTDRSIDGLNRMETLRVDLHRP